MFFKTIAAAVALSASAPDISPSDRFAPRDECDFDHVEASLPLFDAGMIDGTPEMLANPDLAAAVEAAMPDVKQVYIHDATNGLLLVGGQRLTDGPVAASPEEARTMWQSAADFTRSECERAGIACEIAVMEEAPFGLMATTHMTEAGEAIRRQTMTIMATDRCSYSLQFTGVESSLNEASWSFIETQFHAARDLIARQTRSAQR